MPFILYSTTFNEKYWTLTKSEFLFKEENIETFSSSFFSLMKKNRVKNPEEILSELVDKRFKLFYECPFGSHKRAYELVEE